jgi:hypothetical protein
MIRCRTFGIIDGQSRERAGLHRDGGACFERGRFLTLVGACLDGSFVDVATVAKPRGRTVADASNDRIEFARARRRCRMKEHAPLLVARKHTIEHDDVKMHIEIQASHVRPQLQLDWIYRNPGWTNVA